MASRATKPASQLVKRGGIATSTWLIGLVLILCIVGAVMVGSASSVISMSLYGSPWSIFTKDIVWVSAGLIMFVVTARTDYNRWRKLTPLILGISLVSLLVVLAPGMGASAGGASRWIGFGQARFQPSEIMKLALALYGADILCRRIEARSPLKQVAMPLLTVAALSILLVLAQPDLGTAMVLIVITGSMFFAAGVPRKYLVWGALVVVGFVTMAAVAMPYRRARLLSFINPGAKASGSGYQVVQSLIGLGSGHLFGLGLGNSHEKWGLLPNAHTDFIFSIIGEELGLVGVIFVLALICVFVLKGVTAAEQSSNLYGNILGVGLISWIAAEAILNIGAVLGVLPVTGIPLPFISFGGSSLMITMAAAGILVNIARQGGLSKSRAPQTRATPRSSARPRAGAGASRSTTRR